MKRLALIVATTFLLFNSALAKDFKVGNKMPDYKSGTKWQFKFAREFGLPTFYLEPKNWSHKNSHIPKLIKDEGGIQIKNDLSNLDEIYQILMTNNTSRQKVTQIEKSAI